MKGRGICEICEICVTYATELHGLYRLIITNTNCTNCTNFLCNGITRTVQTCYYEHELHETCRRPTSARSNYTNWPLTSKGRKYGVRLRTQNNQELEN